MRFLLITVIIILSIYPLLMIRSAMYYRKLRLSRKLGSFEVFYSKFSDSEEILEKRMQILGIMEIYNSPYVEMFPLKTVDDYVRMVDKVLEDRIRLDERETPGQNYIKDSLS